MCEKLCGHLERHFYAVKIETKKELIKGKIRAYLKRRTTTFGNNKSLEVARISFDWPDYLEHHRSPQLQVVARATEPTAPSYTHVQYILDRINEKIQIAFSGLKLQIEVKRINMTALSGRDVIPEPVKFNLERISEQDTVHNLSPPEPEIKA